jgi:hypothetical protein
LVRGNREVRLDLHAPHPIHLDSGPVSEQAALREASTPAAQISVAASMLPAPDP